MDERKQLEEAISALEAQCSVLGDAVIETALTPLRERLSVLNTESGMVSGKPAQPAAPPSGDRRVVTILFCDVKGSTAMAERLDPEEWAAVMNHAYEYLIEPINRHGGSVAQLLGDGLLAFFGAPAAHEDDPQRAVSAGLEILEGIGVFQGQMRRERGLMFNVRVGIHTGLVVMGEVGAEQRVEYLAMGDAVNLAARMEQTARPGTVQISSQTYRLVEQFFECEPLGEIQVKGKHEPVRAYRVVGLKVEPGRVRGLERQGLYSPLIGREGEFAALMACIHRLLDGQGGIVSILGEAGLGKSRLVSEVRGSLADLRIRPRAEPGTFRDEPAGIQWLEGQTLSFGQTISYWPFQQILRDWAGIAEDDPEPEAWAKLENKVRELFGTETIDYLPFLASLLAFEVKGEYAERVRYLDGDAMGKGIFLTSRHFFERLAQTQPAVLVFEDLHWMDESSALLLEHLLPLAEGVPLLFIGLSRLEQDTPAARLREICAREHASLYTEVRLPPLTEADSEELVSRLLKFEDLPPHLRGMIVERADGNPFYLEEVIRTLIDTGVIARDPASGRWQEAVHIESIHLPDTIQGVIMARVDRLDEEVKRVLRTASVIGRSFLYRVLKAISDAGGRLENSLIELQQTGLICEKQVAPKLEYMFKHALAQEATYENILVQKRRELHARVGGAIEKLFADRLEEFYGLLAYHYARAEAWDKAQAYLLKAADQAGRIAADVEALAHYRQAMAAYPRAITEQWDPLQRASLERKIGEALFRRGEHAQAADHLRRALDYLGSPLPTSRWAVRLTILREIVLQAGYRLLPGIFLRRPPQPASEAIEEQGRIYESLGWISAVNPEDILLVMLRTLNFSERNRFIPGMIFGFASLQVVCDFMALSRLAGYYGQKSVDLAGQSQTPGAQVTAYAMRAVHENIQSHWNGVTEFAQRVIEIQRQSGYWNTRAWALAIMSLADGHIHQGEFAQALERSLELAQFGQDSADRQARCWGAARQGYAQHGLGKLEEAAGSLAAAMELAKSIPDYQTFVDSGGELGKCFLRQGKLGKAFEVFEECRRRSAEQNLQRSPVITRYINGLAEAHLLAAERGDETQRANSLKRSGRACREALRQGKAYPPGMPEAMMLQGRFEWLIGKRRQAQKWWRRSLILAEQMDVRYDLGRTYLEIGQRLGERVHLEQAEDIFARCGAEFDLGMTRQLLQSPKPDRSSPIAFS